MSKLALKRAQERLQELKYGKEAWALIKELRQECEDRADCESSLLDWNEKLFAALEVYADEKNWDRSYDEYDMLDMWAGPVGDEVNEDGDIPNNGFHYAQKVLAQYE